MKFTALLGIGLALWVIDVPGDGLAVRSANAIVGAPLTPVSVAGVARRTTRRVVATEAAVATTAAATTAAAASAPNPSAPPPAAPGAPLPVGSIVTALPPGCVQTILNGIAYERCGSTYYQASMMGSNLVFVVAQP
jgi:hypothetical protein